MLALKKSRRPEGRRLSVGGSGDDAPMLAGALGVGRDCACRCEVEIALERKSQRAAGAGELCKAHVTEFGFAEAEIAEAECQVDVGVELREEPCGVAVGSEKLHGGFKVQRLILTVDRVALRASVLEEFLALGGADEMVWTPPLLNEPGVARCWVDEEEPGC
jgi:hypothetical protein